MIRRRRTKGISGMIDRYEEPVKYERYFHSLKAVKDYERIVKDQEDYQKALSNQLYQRDRCNYCIINDYFYKHACKEWNNTCFPDFIEQEEMEL